MPVLIKPPRGVAIGIGLMAKFSFDSRRQPDAPTVGASKPVVNVVPAPRVLQQKGESLVSPSVIKGRLTNAKTRFFKTFMFNPNTVSMVEGWGWGEHTIAGGSHPVTSGGSGVLRTISFTLRLDSDRGRMQNRGRGRVNVEDANEFKSFSIQTGRSLDLTEEINFYRSFTYPDPFSSDKLRERGPARAFLHLGPLFPGVECVVRQVNPRITQFNINLEPTLVDIDIVLSAWVQQSVSANDVFKLPAEYGQ